MGNKNNRAKKLQKSFPEASINDLPVEIIYKILDQLDICIIFTSLHHVCKRFDEILLTYGKYHLNFEKLSFNELKLICSRIHPEQVTELTLSDDENRAGFIDLFLSKFSLDSFTCLRSLTLKQINDDEMMNRILIPMADRHSLLKCSSLKIINSAECYDDVVVEIITSILTKSTLREVHFDLSYSRTTTNPLPWIELSSIQMLTFSGMCTVNFIRNLLICVPELKSLTMDDIDFDDEVDLNYVPNPIDTSDEESDDEPIEPEIEPNRKVRYAPMNTSNPLKSLVLNTCSIPMLKLEWLLEEIPTLKNLRLTTVQDYNDLTILDGQRWEKLLINVERFQFLFVVNLSSDPEFDIDACLMKFRTHFWTEGRQWFVGLEKYDDDLILYSLPYSHQIFMIKNNFTSFENRSTAPDESKFKLQSMNSVRDLYIETSDMKKSSFQDVVPRFRRVKNLYLYGKWPRSKTFFDDLQSYVDLNTIEELLREDALPTKDLQTLLDLMPNLQSIKTTSHLVNPLNAKRFSYYKTLRSFLIETNNYVEQTPINIEPFCEMFPQIEHLDIPVNSIDDCNYLMENLSSHLRSVIFRIPPDPISYSDTDDDEDENEPNPTADPFSDWMKELPRRYYCQKRQQQLHIWLK